MPESQTSIEIRNVYKLFGPHPERYVEAVRDGGMNKAELLDKHNHVLGLSNVSLDIEAGHIQVIMGLSGSGKSTLIRHINRLIEPTAGEVIVGGTDVRALKPRELRDFRRTSAAMVFQKFALLPHRTVLGNVVFGLEIRGLPRDAQLERARQWIDRVGLTCFEDKYPSQLSGGMQQRVGLARALANDAPILLMDEAFSALDPLIRVDMQTILLDLQAEVRKTVVFITHDLDEALRIGDRVAIMQDGELVQQGRPEEIVLSPATGYVEDFVRQVNRGRVVKVAALARPLAGPPAALRMPSALPLADAALRLVEARLSFADVTDGKGAVVGRVHLDEVVRTLARSAGEAEASDDPPARLAG
ncbi:glycine betaine transporter subunit; ATP-binding compoent of ABC superfamily [uncultured Pleomorphomonas sp.]|uniref:Quaternary amine transport ATP-binding protein n=1 Tax=uncultured Pleomorphomonas sp. TaxID=442121 RepID=A0A212L2M7_9HYPH|nr:glycine betaine/L-proline ABC transporter ATP-binding protein [uncultured Pleomorphomonas sp.]SCM71790.1 glycine betaine transporter subunit; ATP-binding compoent of ABC superfamily [uncultured Pleomorphomonas sp.]